LIYIGLLKMFVVVKHAAAAALDDLGL